MSYVLKRRVGRYVIFDAFARGGMASVHFGRLVADRGFSRLVAIKMASLERDASSRLNARALEEEARIASRIRHPNVVQPLDFVVDGDDLLIVMEYVHGVSLSELLLGGGGASLDPTVKVAVLVDVLAGLHAAHEATDERGRPLGVVHRDVSPQNILVGADGIARLADFGIAKVMRAAEHTATGIVKGKLSYMPPEQLRGLPLTRQADVFAAGAVLAEVLSGIGPGAPDPDAADPAAWLASALAGISDRALLDVAVTATKPEPRDRYASALEMGAALAAALSPARAAIVADRVTVLAGDELELRTELVRAVEAEPLDDVPAPAGPVRGPRLARRAVPPLRRGLIVAAGGLIALAIWIKVSRPAHDDVAVPTPVPAASTAIAPEEPSPSSTKAVSQAPHVTPAVTGVPKVRPPRARASARTVSSDCTPPFRIDADGKKHYRPECLE